MREEISRGKGGGIGWFGYWVVGWSVWFGIEVWCGGELRMVFVSLRLASSPLRLLFCEVVEWSSRLIFVMLVTVDTSRRNCFEEGSCLPLFFMIGKV